MKIQRTTNKWWRAPWKTALLALGIYAAQSIGQQAFGQYPTYPGYGTGTVSYTITPGTMGYTDSVRSPVTMTNPISLQIGVASPTGFLAGQRVIVVQMASCTSGCAVGNYYISTINSIAGSVITFNSAGIGLPMPAFCTGPTDRVQAIVIPEWFDLDIFGTYTCHAWDGFTGGILCFYVKNILNVFPSGIITSEGTGYSSNLLPGTGGAGGLGGGTVGAGGNPSSPANGSDGFAGGDGGSGAIQPGFSGISKCPQYKGGDGGWGGGPVPGAPGTPGMSPVCFYPPSPAGLVMGNGGWRSGDGGKGAGGGGEGGGGGGSLNNGMPGMPGGNGGNGGDGGGPEGPGGGAILIKAEIANLIAVPSISARGGNGQPGQPGGPGGYGGDGGNGSDDDANVGAGGGGGFGWRGDGGDGGNGSDGGDGGQIRIITSFVAPPLFPMSFDMDPGMGGTGGLGGDPFPTRASFGITGNSSATSNYCPVIIATEICDCQEAYKALAMTTSATMVGTQMVFTDGAGLVCTYENGHLSCATPATFTTPATPSSGDIYTQIIYTCDVDPLTDCYQLFDQIRTNYINGPYVPGTTCTFGSPGPVYSSALLTDGTFNCYDKPCVVTCIDCPKKGADGTPGNPGRRGYFDQPREHAVNHGHRMANKEELSTGETPGNGETAGLAVNPNPASEKITVSFNSELAGTAKVRITNMQGVILATEEVSCKPGNNKVEMNIAAYKPGTYLVTVETKQSTASKQFIKN